MTKQSWHDQHDHLDSSEQQGGDGRWHSHGWGVIWVERKTLQHRFTIHWITSVICWMARTSRSYVLKKNLTVLTMSRQKGLSHDFLPRSLDMLRSDYLCLQRNCKLSEYRRGQQIKRYRGTQISLIDSEPLNSTGSSHSN